MSDLMTLTNSAPVVYSPMWHKGPDGTFVKHEPTPADRELHCVPPKGRYRLKFTGIAEPFEIDDHFNPGQQKTMTRLEFQILRGRNLTGRLFTQRWTWSLHEMSTMGKFFERINGEAIPQGASVDVRDFIGIEFEANVNPDSKDKYAPLVVDSIMRDEDDDDPADDEDGAAVFGFKG